jgi:16S rRNA A1518/A1519 N6-dimethyltransferase RsmA/KsgA/DIM1 with predicted DNA glycosylase/AP lyase activity
MEAERRWFNAHAANYHGGRPRYPDEIFEALVRVAGLGNDCRVVEIGAGSGLATGPILATGARRWRSSVVAVEPGVDLAAILRGRP